jgi:hypothetical protein
VCQPRPARGGRRRPGDTPTSVLAHRLQQALDL